MATRASKVTIGGFIIIIVGLIIVIVHALNMGTLDSVQTMLPELGLILIGIAVQLLGLGAILVSKK